jgi:hypothetical protein
MQKYAPLNLLGPSFASLIEASGCIEPVAHPISRKGFNTSEDSEPLVCKIVGLFFTVDVFASFSATAAISLSGVVMNIKSEGGTALSRETTKEPAPVLPAI